MEVVRGMYPISAISNVDQPMRLLTIDLVSIV